MLLIEYIYISAMQMYNTKPTKALVLSPTKPVTEPSPCYCETQAGQALSK